MFHLLLTFLSLMFSTSNPRSKASETSATAWCLGSVKPTDSLPVHQKSWRHAKTPRYFRRWRLTKPGCSIPWDTLWNQGVQGQPVRPEFFLQLLPKFHHLRDWEHLGCSNLDHFHVRENPTGNMAGKIHLERIDVRKRMISWELFVGLMDKVDCSSINEMPFKNLQGNKGYLHRNRGIESFSTAVEDIQKASSTWFSSTKLHLRLRWFLGNLPSSDSWRDFRYSNSSVNPSPIAFWGIWKKVGFAANGAARGKEVLPMSMESTRLAQSRPSAMAVTTKEAPRRQSPQAYKLLQGASSACKR